MLVYALLLALLAVATVTDVRGHKIYNWNTYPGILLGLIVNTVLHQWAGLEAALLGGLGLFIVMLACFVLFNVGGGDVKLIAMMGAFLGLHKGVEAMLWTFVVGGVMGVAILIWQFGAWTILKNTLSHFRLIWRAKGWVALTEEEREPLRRWLYLAPAAFASVAILAADAEYGFLQQIFG